MQHCSLKGFMVACTHLIQKHYNVETPCFSKNAQMFLFIFVMSTFPYHNICNKHTESEFNVGEFFREIYDTVASKEDFSTGNYFVKLLDVLLR